MSLQYEGRVAVITGAAGSLGSAYARAFAERGARLVVNDLGGDRNGTGRSPTPVQRLAEQIEALGGQAIANNDDIASRSGALRLVECAMDRYGRLDVLVNNAGIMRDRSFKKMDLDDFDEVLRVNLTGPAYVSHAAFPHMVARSYGRILMTTSASGLYGVFGAANYAAAKMGLVGLMRALHIEGARHNVRVNAIAPVASSRLLGDFASSSEAGVRLGPEWVVPLVLYLCSEGALCSGQVFAAGGGCYSRAAMVEGPGWRASQVAPPTPEDIAAKLDPICDLEGAREFADSTEVVRQMIERS
jgi:NAD(P)-dependent dehydrogenase (short-subunit alcohol dehydrogenase family)